MTEGTGTLMKKAAESPGVRFLGGTAAHALEKTASGWLVKAEGLEIEAQHLALATEAPRAAELLRSLSPALADHLEKLPMSESTAFSVATEKDNMSCPPFGYMISTHPAYRSVVSRDVVADERYRGFTVHFVKSGFDDALPDLWRILGIKDPRALATTRHTFTLPRLGVGHEAWRAELSAICAGIGHFDLLGNFFGGLALEDCAVRGKEAALHV